VYDVTNYSDTARKTGLFNAKGDINFKSASLRAEYNLMNNTLRLVAGVSANKFNYPDTVYGAYQIAATYKVTKENLLRIVYSQAPRSSSIYDTYVDQTIAFFPAGFKKSVKVLLEGNKNLKLLSTTMIEIGYRGKINSSLNIDVEAFHITGKNYNTLVQTRPYVLLIGTDTLVNTPIVPTNLPLTLHQSGITVSLSYSSKKLQIKPFATLQKTIMKNYAPFLNTPDGGAPGAKHIYSGMGSKATLESTPAIFGGASLNYVPSSKWNVNLNAYYYSAQKYYHVTNVFFNDGIRGIDDIEGKFIINANVSFEAINGLHLFLNGKNLLNKKSREFFKTDETPCMLLGGINFEL